MTSTLGRLGALTLVLSAAAALAGCGKMGALERPGPLFGQGRATSTEATQAEGQAQDPTRPVNTIDPRDRTADPSPPRTAPLDAAPSDPFASQPQGVTTNPYARPQ